MPTEQSGLVLSAASAASKPDPLLTLAGDHMRDGVNLTMVSPMLNISLHLVFQLAQCTDVRFFLRTILYDTVFNYTSVKKNSFV